MLENLPGILGHALRDQRAGMEQTAFNRIPLRGGTAAIDLRSLAFVDHGPIPALYTADGSGTSPPLQWTGVPAAADSLVLIVEDADSPTPQPLVHAIVVNLDAEDGSLPDGALAEDNATLREAASDDGVAPRSADNSVSDAEAPAATQPRLGRNSYLLTGWLPPDPPPGHGVHHYVFQIFALAPGGRLTGTPGRDAVLAALSEHALASGRLVGTYTRPDATVRDTEREAVPTSMPLA